MLLPAVAFELGIEMFFLRKSDAEVGNELPAFGHSERTADFFWVKDRNPSNTDTLRPCSEPKSMNRGDNRIIERLWHRPAAKAKARLRRMIAKDRKVHRCLVQPGELEARIEGGALTFIRLERRRVARVKIVDHGLTRQLRFDAYKTPRLAVANGWREGSGAYQILDERGRQGVGFETPDIAPPSEKLLQAAAKAFIENGRAGFLVPARRRLSSE
jgi:hypothetical protein